MFRFRKMGSRRESVSKEEKSCQVPNRYNPILISQIALTNQFPSHRYNKNRARKSSGPATGAFLLPPECVPKYRLIPFILHTLTRLGTGGGTQQGAQTQNAIGTHPTV